MNALRTDTRPQPGPYAPPRVVTDLADCWFYHTMDIPDHGLVTGQWDLRGGEERYLGGVDVGGRRVLEVGTASGHLCFHMERRGAEVVAYDLSEKQAWDVVPFARNEWPHHKPFLRQVNNGWWLAHRAFGSRARVAYGTVYAIPEALGPVDVGVLGSILLHVRDPFLALQNAARLTRDTLVVAEPLWDWQPPPPPAPPPLLRRLYRALRPLPPPPPPAPPPPAMTFLPDSRTGLPTDTWWQLTPEVICRFLGVLGFEDTRVSRHEQLYNGRPFPLFTVVGRRTHGQALSPAGHGR